MPRILFIVVGIGLLVVAIAVGVSINAFISKAVAAEGKVVEVRFGGSHPQIEFTSATGQRISYPQGGFIFGYKLGDRVRVLYDPAEPLNSACINEFGALWFTPLILSIIGLFCGVSGLLSAGDRTG